MKGPGHTWISDILSVVMNYLAPAILLIVTHIRRPLATQQKQFNDDQIHDHESVCGSLPYP